MIQYQLLMGLIKTELDFSDSAELFEMIANRIVTMAGGEELWQWARGEVRKATAGIFGHQIDG